MENVVMLIVSLVVGMLGSVLRKYYTKKNKTGVVGGYVFNAVCSLVAGIVLLCWGGIGSFSAYTAAMGAAFGLLTAVQGVAVLLAFESGPLSYSSVITSFSMIIPALSGTLFFGETIAWAHIVGIALMLVSFVLAFEKKEDEKKANLRWMLFCLIGFLTTGFIGVMQKIHRSSAHKEELNLFLVVAFAVSAVFCAGAALFLSLKKNAREGRVSPEGAALTEEGKSAKARLLLLLLMILCGAGVAVNNKLNLYLSGVINSALFFPVVNGGGLVLTTVSAFIVFRERLTVRQWIGIALGILAVVFLCNPF